MVDETIYRHNGNVHLIKNLSRKNPAIQRALIHIAKMTELCRQFKELVQDEKITQLYLTLQPDNGAIIDFQYGNTVTRYTFSLDNLTEQKIWSNGIARAATNSSPIHSSTSTSTTQETTVPTSAPTLSLPATQ